MGDGFIHFSNIIYLLSYSVRDILWLRIFTVVGASSLIPYFLSREADLSDAIAWNVLFIAINIFQIGRIVKERRPAHLDQRAEQLYQTAAKELTRNQFAQLIKLGEWKTGPKGTVLVRGGEELDRFFLLATGSARVTVGEREVGQLGPGTLVGEAELFSPELPVATVTLEQESEYLCWASLVINSNLSKEAGLREAVQKMVASHLASKLNTRARGGS